MKKQSLILQAIAKLLIGMVIIGVLVFVSAGSVHYWQGWIFMSTLFVPMLFAGAVLAIKNPTLLQKRLHAKEREVRIKHEEELLTEELCGYKEYRQRVRYKLFPGIW